MTSHSYFRALRIGTLFLIICVLILLVLVAVASFTSQSPATDSVSETSPTTPPSSTIESVSIEQSTAQWETYQATLEVSSAMLGREVVEVVISYPASWTVTETTYQPKAGDNTPCKKIIVSGGGDTWLEIGHRCTGFDGSLFLTKDLIDAPIITKSNEELYGGTSLIARIASSDGRWQYVEGQLNTTDPTQIDHNQHLLLEYNQENGAFFPLQVYFGQDAGSKEDVLFADQIVATLHAHVAGAKPITYANEKFGVGFEYVTPERVKECVQGNSFAAHSTTLSEQQLKAACDSGVFDIGVSVQKYDDMNSPTLEEILASYRDYSPTFTSDMIHYNGHQGLWMRGVLPRDRIAPLPKVISKVVFRQEDKIVTMQGEYLGKKVRLFE